MDDERTYVTYLFLDIEWNQAPDTIGLEGREAIQIGVIAADAAMRKVKSYSKAIRLMHPELLSKKTIKITHTTLNNIMQGRPEDTVLTNFAQTFPEYQYIVVWNRETYELFKRDMKNYKIHMQKHQVIVLQELINVIADRDDKMIGFETALACVGVEYIAKFLHYSKHDANYLYQLFYTCQQQFMQATTDEYCVANANTKKLHTLNCRYVRNMPLEKILMKPQSSIFKGYVVCKCCGKKEKWKRLKWTDTDKNKIESKKDKSRTLKQLPLTEENINIICSYFRISYSISNAAVFIRTAYSRWIVYLKNDNVTKLLHENFRSNRSQYFKKQRMKCTEGYHTQKLPSNNFFEVIQYIKSHDNSMVKRMAKKNRLEKLFDMVEMELRLKNTEENDYGNDNMPELRRTNIG